MGARTPTARKLRLLTVDLALWILYVSYVISHVCFGRPVASYKVARKVKNEEFVLRRALSRESSRSLVKEETDWLVFGHVKPSQ